MINQKYIILIGESNGMCPAPPDLNEVIFSYLQTKNIALGFNHFKWKGITVVTSVKPKTNEITAVVGRSGFPIRGNSVILIFNSLNPLSFSAMSKTMTEIAIREIMFTNVLTHIEEEDELQ